MIARNLAVALARGLAPVGEGFGSDASIHVTLDSCRAITAAIFWLNPLGVRH